MTNTLITQIFTADAPDPRPWAVEALTWAEPGGPAAARLRSTLPASVPNSPPQTREDDLPEGLQGLLGRAVMVRADTGEPVWWGFVQRVEAVTGGLAVGWDLAPLANRVAVRYVEQQPGAGWLKDERVTAWLEDGASVQRFGRKEQVISLPAATPAEAEKARAAALEAKAHPRITARWLRGQPNGLYIEARGWWDTLDWVHYAQPAGELGYPRSGGSSLSVGYSTSSREFCQSFVPDCAWDASEIWLHAGHYGRPTDPLRVELVRWEAGVIAETLATVDTHAEGLPSGREWVRFALPAAVSLQAQVNYGIRVRRTGANSSAHYYTLSGSVTGVYPFRLSEWNGSAWVASAKADTLSFQVIGQANTMTQAAAMLAPQAGGQFLAGCRLPAVTAEAHLFRGGERRVLAELLDLLAAGDGTGEALTARVTAERWLVIAPAKSLAEAALVVTPGGRVQYIGGGEVALHAGVTGQPARLGAGLGGGAVRITRAAWTPRQGRVVSGG